MKAKLVKESLIINESFWVELKDKYDSESHNGETYLNVSGVPGGYNISGNTFINRLEKILKKTKYVITKEIVNKSIRLLRDESNEDAKQIKKDLSLSDEIWFNSLHGENDYIDDRYDYPGAAYLIWFMDRHTDEILGEFDY